MGCTNRCQSCGAPIKDFGTNADGSRNDDYCKYCYEHGVFTSKITVEEMINRVVSLKEQLGANEAELKQTRQKYQLLFSTLKRWKR